MSYENGRLPDSALSPIPGGRLRHDAARAWNDGPAKAGLRPTGPVSSYRTYDKQVEFWNLYISGRGNLAARPGTSNHGWGNAVDLAEPWMREWINNHGAQYGWRKVEAPSEWWHVNFVGGYAPKPSVTRFLPARIRRAANNLLARRRARASEALTGRGTNWHRLNRAVHRSTHKLRLIRRRAHGRTARILKRVLNDRDGRV